jgi:hypothetical protein
MADKPFYTNPPWTFKQERPEYIANFERQIINELDFSKPTSLYLYNINTEEWVIIPVIPDSLSASYSANFQPVTTHGLIRPVRYYTGGSEKSVSFTIKMHEDLQYKYSNTKSDEYANTKGNLYALVDVIKRLSEPPNTDHDSQVLLPPKVYFQLGNQFAGTGHIDTSVSFSVPFRNGRYIMADISFTFVFHEIFRLNELTVKTTGPGELTVGIGIDDLPGINRDSDFENFYKESVNIDFIIENSLKEDKMRMLLEGYVQLHKKYNKGSTLTVDTLEEIINTANIAELKNQSESLAVGQGLWYTFVNYLTMFLMPWVDPNVDTEVARYLELLFEFMIKLKLVMAGTYQVETTLDNLVTLKKDMRAKLSDYQLKYPVTGLTTEQQETIREVLSSFDTLEAIIDTQLKLRRRIGSED